MAVREKVYEVSVHYVPTLKEPEVGKKTEELKKAIMSTGEVLGEEPAQKVDLAYTIRHKTRRASGTYDRYSESYFGSVKFRSPQALVRTLHETLQGDDQVIRFLILETVSGDTRIGPVLPGEKEKKDEGGEKKDDRKRKRGKEDRLKKDSGK